MAKNSITNMPIAPEGFTEDVPVGQDSMQSIPQPPAGFTEDVQAGNAPAQMPMAQQPQGDIIRSEPAPQLKENKFVESIRDEVYSGKPYYELSDFALFTMYKATSGTKDVSKLWNSSNPIAALRGSPQENKEYYRQLKKRGWSDEFIKYMTPPEERSLGQNIAQAGVEQAIPTIASAATYMLTKKPSLAAGAAALGEGVNQLISQTLSANFDPASSAKTATGFALNSAKSMAMTGGADYAFGKPASILGKALTPNEGNLLRNATTAGDKLEASYKKAVQVMPKEEVPLRSGDISDKRGIIRKTYDAVAEKLGVELGLSSPVPRPLPSMTTRSNPLSVLENLVEDTMGGGRITKLKEEIMPVASKQYVTDFADDFSNGLLSKLKSGDISQSDIANVIADEISGSRTAWRATEKRAYNLVQTQLEKSGMSTLPIVDVSLAKQEAKQLSALKDKVGGMELPSTIERFADNPNVKLTYSEADELDKFLRAQSREFADSKQWNSKRIVDNIEKSIKGSLDSAANQIGGRIKKTHDLARKISAEGNELFDKQLISNLDKMIDFNDASSQIVTKIFSGEDKIDSVKNILLSKLGKSTAQIERGKKTWDYMNKAYLAESIYNTVKTSPDGVINAKDFFSHFNKIGQSAINKMYTANEQQAIATFVDVLRQTEPVKGKDSFSFIIKSMQAGAAGKLAGTGDFPEAIAILLAPNLIARFITSKTGNALFTEGLQGLRKGGTIGASLSGRMLSELYKNKQEYEKEVTRHEAIIRQIEESNTPEMRDLKRSRDYIFGKPLGL